MKKIKILPCPFCPEEETKINPPYLSQKKEKHLPEPFFSISCTVCGCEPNFYVITKEEAIFKWNNRRILVKSQQDIAYINGIKRKLIKKIISIKD